MKEKKKLRKKYGALLYSSFVKCVFLFYLLAFVLTLEEYPVFNLKKIAIGFIIVTILTVIFYYMRRLCIVHKILFELDAQTAYELDRRKLPLFKKHNLILLYNVYFFEGEFKKAISVCDELLTLSKKKETIIAARQMKILSKFFDEDFESIDEIIEEQRDLITSTKDADYYYMLKEYLFIEAYLRDDYEKALEQVESLLNDEKESSYNSRKIVFQQFKKMICIKNNDVQEFENCNKEILKCDPDRKTYFSKGLENY